MTIRKLRSLTQRLVLPVALAAIAMASVAPAASADRAFTPRFSTEAPGNITITSNTLMTCSTTGRNGAQCAAARANTSAGTTTNSSLNNNNYDMVNVDVDSDPTTANSSTAALRLPAGSVVLFAGLYWASTAPIPLDVNAVKAIKLQGPNDAGYKSLVADVYDPSQDPNYGYNCFKDVTASVGAQGAGSWTAGGVATNQKPQAAAGWSLVVAYQAPGEPLRDLTVFDGQAQVNLNSLVTIPVSGFRTPATGQVKSDVGLVTFEGDRGMLGDYAQLNSTTLTDAKHPPANFFNSWISEFGAATPGRNPDFGNQLGYESVVVSANGVLGNNATSAVIRAKTTNDGYQPSVVTFATELYAPKVLIDKTVSDLNGGEVRVGDELEYTIALRNDGGDGAVSTVLSEQAMPLGTEYVGGSLLVDAAAPAAGLADTPADGGTGPLTVRLGTGATASSGGLIAPGGSSTVKFRVRVTDPLPAEGGKITNTAYLDYAAQTLGSPVSVESAPAELTVRLPDAAITKSVSSAEIADGLPGQYTLAVKNFGSSATEGTTTVTDTLPIAFSSPTINSAVGWSCSIVVQLLSCDRTDALAAGSSYPPIVINSASVTNPSAAVITNTASVTTPLDSDLSNNSSSVTTDSTGYSTIAVAISSDKGSVLPGEPAKLTGTYTNTGPSTATTPTLTLATTDITDSDSTVTGFTVSSTAGSVTSADCVLTRPAGKPTVTCTPTSLLKGETVEIVMVVTPLVGTTLASFEAEATGSAGNDSASPHSATTTVDIVPTADLAITKSASSATVDRGETVDFTLNVINNGPRASGAVTAYDTLPEGLVPESATWTASGGPSSGSGSCTILAATRAVSCVDMDKLSPDGTSSPPFSTAITITITARAANDAYGPRLNTATVESDVDDPDLGNNSDGASVVILPSANLFVGKTGPKNLSPGQTGIFTVTVTNYGPSVATKTVVTDTLDPQMSIVGSLPAGCTAVGRKISCQAGDLATPDSKSYRFKVKISESAKPGATLTNRAEATSDVPDPDPASATDQVKVLVGSIASARIGVAISTPKETVAKGAPLTVRVTVKSRSGATARSVVLCAKLPPNVSYQSSSGRHIGNRVCWAIKSLAVGAKRSFIINALANKSGSANATAAASASNASRVSAHSPIRVATAFTG